MKGTITLERLSAILDAYGSRAYRWPEAERDAALDLLAHSPTARARRNAAAELDAVLDILDIDDAAASPALRKAVLSAAPRPRSRFLPRFSAARMALAASLVLGIVAGSWAGREYTTTSDSSIDIVQATRLVSSFEGF
ncbi:hypothetical protein SAMN07250955_10128 [Arboricoccus pini]|uniref:Uncharacterized protein n=1 Tax=Arboricoccus pini TaxID=1963835 RepID=A0A212PVR7_9PROT|nr:hypothetical protein [Arboricoccus pini]SNB51068.1 hypothetical protein SAMN07250955_10128 [Arboricoccus pini]